MVNHLSGIVVKNCIGEKDYDENPDRWLMVSRNLSTFVIHYQPVTERDQFSVYNEDGTLRLEGSPDMLPNWDSAAISDSGQWFVVSSANGDMQIFDTHSGYSFLWPKADVRDMYGCDFRNSVIEDKQLKEFIKMNGGIVAE